MQSSPNKFMLISLITLMAVMPFRGLWAGVTMSDMDYTDQVHNMMEQHAVMAPVDVNDACDQCGQMQCCQSADCYAGHCMSCSAMISLMFKPILNRFHQLVASNYLIPVFSFHSSPLLHPPSA